MKLQDILLDSDYALELFSQDSIERLESKVVIKESCGGGGKIYYSLPYP